MIGKTLGGYEILEQIGRGGMASVYKARDPRMDRYVALKILPPYYSEDPVFQERFKREAKAIAALEHPHILPVHAYGEEDNVAYLVIRFMPSGTLADLLEQGPLPLHEVSRLLTQVASALDYAHRRGILHRDVKPSNVLLDADGNAYLADFGIARLVEAASDLTGSGIVGTPQYMSPEHVEGGNANVSPASDQYALGVMLYQMVTGRLPFESETPMRVLMMHMNDPLPSAHTLRPDLPEAAEEAIDKALAKNPDARFATCAALASTFASGLDKAARAGTMHRPIETAPPTYHARQTDLDAETVAVTPSSQAAKKRGTPIWLLAGLGGLMVIAVIGAVIFGPRLIGAAPAPTPTSSAPVVNAPTKAPTSRPAAAPTSTPGPMVVEVTVAGNADWVYSRANVLNGQRFAITASGQVNPCANHPENAICIPYGPDGAVSLLTANAAGDPNAAQYPLPDGTIVALAARIGTEGTPFLVGSGGTFSADANGALQFVVNDLPLANNDGAFNVVITIPAP